MIIFARISKYFLTKGNNFNNLLSKPRRFFSENPLNVNTNVTKDVILYKYDNPRHFKIVNIFGFCQFAFWSYLSLFAFNHLKNVSPSSDERAPWWRKVNFGEAKYRNAISFGSFLIGFACITLAWTYTLRSVRYLILNKGGKMLTIVTYTPAGQNRMFTTHLNNISCKESRATATSSLPLKVKGHKLYYIMDMRGEFRNPTLFDQTAGLSRNLKTVY